ncbi:MAG: hypothetical protein ACJ0HI_03875, partial [Gammaproteobacteria bacterium]
KKLSKMALQTDKIAHHSIFFDSANDSTISLQRSPMHTVVAAATDSSVTAADFASITYIKIN